jgi:hypothetical protein
MAASSFAVSSVAVCPRELNMLSPFTCRFPTRRRPHCFCTSQMKHSCFTCTKKVSETNSSITWTANPPNWCLGTGRESCKGCRLDVLWRPAPWHTIRVLSSSCATPHDAHVRGADLSRKFSIDLVRECVWAQPLTCATGQVTSCRAQIC